MSVSRRSLFSRPRPRRNRASGSVRRRVLLLESLEDRRLLAAEPTVTLDVPADPFIGTSPLTIRATFDNTSLTPTDVGYGPFVDLVFPRNGADGAAGTQTPDGVWPISPAQATYLGDPVTTHEYVFPASGCLDHPYAVDNTNTPLQVCGTPGDVLVVVQLPFGSFTPDQPPATIELPATLSNYADLGHPLTFTARGGFQFGSDPLNNPSVDPTLFLDATNEDSDSSAWTGTATTTPTVMRMTKTYLGPEDETATGPNFPRQYELVVSIAPGQTVTDLDIMDGFDNNVVVTGVTVTTTHSPAPTNIPTLPFGPANFSFPSQQLVATIPTVTGIGGADVRMLVDFYVPEFDANGDRIIPINGEDDLPDSRTFNDARALGDWTPLDPRDLGGVDNAEAQPDPVNPDHILDNKSIAIQKSVAVVGGDSAGPGVYLEYTLEFQVSDYYTFGDFVITDTISDGQDFVYSVSTTTFTVSDRDGATTGTFALGTDLTHTVNVDGTETLVFNLSAAMKTATGTAHADGILVGGLATAADDLGKPPQNIGLQAGAVGTVVFRVQIPDLYSSTQPGGNDFVAQGDAVSNTATISGTVRDNGAPTTTIHTEDDDTSAGIQIPIGEVSKSIYAVNGVYPPPPNFILAPGDDLTYSIKYTLPLTSFVNFSLNDFLPLPVFDVTKPTGVASPWSFVLDGDRTNAPAPGVVELGPGDTLYDFTAGSSGPDYFSPPTITTYAAANSIRFNYGSYNSSTNEPKTVELLFTIKASDRPFADGMFLTNIVRATEANSALDASVQDAIIYFPLGQPALNITKGVVATDHPAPPAAFAPAPPVAAPLTATAPGTSGFRFSGDVTSDYLSATPLDSNLQNIDAGDLVTFVIVVENTGSSRKGAFDVHLRDTLPSGFVVPSGGLGLNLSVTDGTGATIAYTKPDGSAATDMDLFGGGIQLVDPGPTPTPIPDPWDGTDGGALDQYNATSGRNVLIITYDLLADTSVEPRETIVNTAVLTSYAGVEGGENHVPSTDQPSDTARVTIVEPAIDKTITGTNQAHTLNQDVAIGEIVTYQVVVTVPEGTTSNAKLVDVLDSGLAFVEMVGITASPGVSTSVGSFAAVASNVAVANVGGGAEHDGRQITLDFGTIINTDTDNGVDETITITYRAVVLNTLNNNRGDARNNLARWQWEDDFGPQNVEDNAPDVVIVEPTLEVIKTVSPLTGDAGDLFTFTITVQHTTGVSNTDAFDVVLTDMIPAGLTYETGTLSFVSGLAPTSLTESSGTITGQWSSFPLGNTSTFQFGARTGGSVTPGQKITNEAEVRYTSLPGPVTTPQSSHNGLSTERTGNTGDPGGSANDYRHSDSADITVHIPSISKSIVATSELSTIDTNVAIGEIVRYRLKAELIEGASPKVQFVDVLEDGLSFLDKGQVRVSFVSASSITSPDGGWDLAGANGGAIPPTFVMPADRISVAGQQITFDFGTLVNPNHDADVEYIILEFNALVRNTTATNDGDVKSNRVELYIADTLVHTSALVDVTIREPAIVDLNKQIVGPTPRDAGDTVTYQVTYSNTGHATAFDVRVRDVLNASYLTLALPPAITLGGGAAGPIDNSSGNTIDVTISEVPVGGSVTITYTATLTAAVEPGLVVNNTANVTYTSLPGSGTPSNPTGSVTPGGSGADNGERDGSGGNVNDYHDTDSEHVTIVSPTFSKTFTDTNQIHTSGRNVAIGEIVTYTMVVTVPEGTMPNAKIVDTPDAGLAIVAVDSITVNNPSALTTDVSGGFSQVRLNANGSIPVDGSHVTLDFGTLTNTDNNNTVAETITIVYRAVVLNTVFNARGWALDNAATLSWSEGALTRSADPVVVVEPTLRVDKQNGDPPLGDAGDVITFTIVVQHASGSNADAFDVHLADSINSMLATNKMTYEWGSVHVVDAGGATQALGSPDETGGDLNITWTSFPVGATSTITFNVTLDVTVNPDEVLTNTADLTWTSLPGDVTGQQSSNPYSVERTGDPTGPGEDGANTYSTHDDGHVLTPTNTMNKEVLDTSEPSTGAGQHNSAIQDLTIGEEVTFAIVVNFIDGTTNDVVITDQLPIAPGVLEYVGASLSFVGADLTTDGATPIAFPTPIVTDTNGDGIPDRIVLNFGTIVNAADTRPPLDAEDQLVVLVTARVRNVPANQNGLVLTNTATVTSDGAPSISDTAAVELVEPALTIAKGATPTVVDGGDTVTFTITVGHTGASTADAFDVAIADALPTGLTYAGNVQALAGPGPTVTVAGQGVTFAWSSIPLGAGPYTFTFDVTVDPSIVPGQTFTNVADLDWSTLPGDDPYERTYTDSDEAPVVSSSTTLRDPAKSLVVTSEPSTIGSDVAIGEIVRYRLRAELTEGTFPNLVFVDTLPAGLSFLDAGQVRVSFTSDVPMGLAPDLSGANNGALPPTFVLPLSRIVQNGQEVRFNFGDVVNNDNDLDAEYVTLEFNVLVGNTADTNALDTKSNAFAAFVDETQYGTTQSVDVHIVEPLIDDVDKHFVSMAGNQRTFEVSFSNTGIATAFDTLVGDVIPSGATLDMGSIVVNLAGWAAGASTVGSTPGLLQVRIDEIPVNGSVTIRYTLIVNDPGSSGMVNTADVTYTSLPGPNGTTVNPTGSSTPGGPGSPNGERDGAGGVNDYQDSDTESLGALGDLVWHDLDGDGVWDAGEPGLPNVGVTAVWAGPDGIFGTADDVTLTTTTDGDGNYLFSDLPPGDYRVAVNTNDVSPLIPSYDLDGALDSTTVVTLGSGQTRLDADFGYTDPSFINGIKYRDDNGNGSRDPGEPPLAGVTIYIDRNNNGALDSGERTTVTDASGAYSFGGLLPGIYVIRELRPDNSVQTQPAGGGGHTVAIVTPGAVMNDITFGNRFVPAVIVDDGDPEFSVSGNWEVSYCEIFYQSDAHYICGTLGGTNVAQWRFTGLVPGATYRVSATWAGGSGRSTDAPYTVIGGAAPVTAVMNQRLSPAAYPGAFWDQGAVWADLTSAYTIFGSELTVQLSDATSGGCVIADAIRIIQVTTPEISVWDGGASLTSGVSQVDLGQTTVGRPLPRQFVIRNEGGANLTLGAITLPSGYSLVQGLGSTTLLPGQSTTFRVQLDAAALGTYAGTITVGNNDNNESPFALGITGTVGAVYNPTEPPAGTPPAPPAAAPESVVVLQGNQVLYSGLSRVDFGTTNVPVGVTQTFRILNPATATANVTLGALSLPTGFSSTYTGNGVVLAPGASFDFTVTLDAASAGTFSGDLRISGIGGDLPFVLPITGHVVAGLLPLAAPLYVDNGDPGYTASPGFSNRAGTGFGGDYALANGDNTGDLATWTFEHLPEGSFSVATSYFERSTRTATARYTVSWVDPSGNPQTRTVDVNQQVAAKDIFDRGIWWAALGGAVQVGNDTTLRVQLSDFGGATVTGDAVRVEQLNKPEITVLDEGTELTSGSSIVDFGGTSVGTAVSRVITVRNDGGGPLELPASLIPPAGFTLTTPFGSTLLAAGQSTTFTLRLDAAVLGNYGGLITFANNDDDESPFRFTVQGVVTSGGGAPLTAPIYVDNGDPAYYATAGFSNRAGSGYQGDYALANGDASGDYAQWTFANLPVGTFSVATSYFERSTRTANAQYTVSWVDQAGVSQNQTVIVNQRVAANDIADQGIWWKRLGISFEVRAGSTLTVRLSDDGGATVTGDAVRVEQLDPLLAAGGVPDALAVAGATLAAAPTDLVRQAVALWAAADPSAAARLANVEVIVADLPGQTLGLASAWTRTIWLDGDAAGMGWATGDRSLGAAGRAAGFDLLTVIAHELGHVLGYADEHGGGDGDLMDHALSPGVQRLPQPAFAPLRAVAVGAAGDELLRPVLGSGRSVQLGRGTSAAARTDAGLAALLAEPASGWAVTDDETARLTIAPRRHAAQHREHRLDDVLASVGDWLDPLDEVLRDL